MEDVDGVRGHYHRLEDDEEGGAYVREEDRQMMGGSQNREI